jgi:effector-binding domain-containing protein
VFDNISDLTNWQHWSPWACLDPNMSTNCRRDYLSWESKIMGIGNMRVISQNSNNINIDLHFIKPFKSRADINFKLEETNGSTLVTWQMDSKLPVFLYFFKKMFQVLIGRDFERGLNRLQYLSETGKVPVKLKFIDEPQNISGFKTTGISSSCDMSNIADSMRQIFSILNTKVAAAQIVPLNYACFCDKVKITKEIMYYTAAAIYVGKDAEVKGLINRDIPDHKAIKVIITGSYDFMGDGWAGIYAHARGLKFKMNKKVPPYEIYLKGPHNTDNPEDYVTEIYMPVR